MPRLRKELFTSRVARRILTLLAVVAVVPLLLLAGLSLHAVSDQLQSQKRAQMERVAKAAGMAVLERLQLLEAKLRIAVRASDGTVADDGAAAWALEGFTRLLPAGDGPAAPGDPETAAHLGRGGPILHAGDDGSLLLGLRSADGPVVWGEVDPDFLWPTAEAYADIGALALFCVLGPGEVPLYCDSPIAETMAGAFANADRSGSRGPFEWSSRGRDYVGSYWELFLRPSHRAEPWIVVVSEDRRLALSEMDGFRHTLPVALLAALVTVLLLANVQIRRTTEPIEKLHEGTKRVGERQFDTRVDIRSGDEFEDVGAAFNAMVRRLDMQFRQLEAGREIDRAVLSSIEPDEVVRAVLEHFGRVVPSDRLGVLLLEDEGDAVLHTDPLGASFRSETIELDAPALDELRRTGGDALTARTSELPPALTLPADAPGGSSTSLVLPMTVQRDLRGALIAEREAPFEDEDVERGRQIADQTGVALSGAWLISDLEEMGWGTLRVLAGAIDAASPWSRGHSGRVARMSVALGRRLGLPEAELAVLERGALLHDVGKIGVPDDALDPAGPADEEARQLLRQHVDIGVRILEPLRAFRPVLPLVRQHHERWDGAGYPEGRRGTGIHRLARVLAVANAYDNVTSPRPYRGAMSPAAALGYIEREAERAFDPEVVAALVGVVRDEENDRPAERDPERGDAERTAQEVIDATA